VTGSKGHEIVKNQAREKELQQSLQEGVETMVLLHRKILRDEEKIRQLTTAIDNLEKRIANAQTTKAKAGSDAKAIAEAEHEIDFLTQAEEKITKKKSQLLNYIEPIVSHIEKIRASHDAMVEKGLIEVVI
jgi:DNA repair exonuclease SbcCD ATPase subunit